MPVRAPLSILQGATLRKTFSNAANFNQVNMLSRHGHVTPRAELSRPCQSPLGCAPGSSAGVG